MTQTERILVLVTAVCAGLCAGVFFAFSTFVMPALHKLRSAEALTAMQAINRAAPNGLFMTVLFGPVIALVWLVVATLRRPAATTGYVLAGTACFIAGVLVLCIYHVPHNNALDTVDPAGASAADRWRTYYAGWTAWNHVRTVAFTAATACFALALRTD
jgi:uncharacterized membrane protein